jgi:hypothetical protein
MGVTDLARWILPKTKDFILGFPRKRKVIFTGQLWFYDWSWLHTAHGWERILWNYMQDGVSVPSLQLSQVNAKGRTAFLFGALL